jgi:hypothetical protein
MAPKDDDARGHEPPSDSGGEEASGAPLVLRKIIWIDEDLDERLRKAALVECTSEAELVRRALRLYFDIE